MVDFIWIAVITGFMLWWAAIYALDRRGLLKPLNITTWGPLLIWRTYRGQKFLDALAAPKTFWKVLVTAGIPIVLLSMVLMLILTLFSVAVMLISTPEPGAYNAPQNILAIPGLNQYIPFVWGWIALIVALVVHEFGHAIMAKAEKVKVKSLGLMLIPAPLGAFAEIDEEQLFGTKSEGASADVIGPMDTKAAGTGARKASSMAFIRILGAGVIMNFIVAFLAFALLFGVVLGAVSATNSGMVVVNVAPDSAASTAGVQKNMILESIDGQNFTTSAEINAYLDTRQGSNVTISGMQGDKPVSYTLTVPRHSGVYVLGAIEEGPAASAGMKPGYQIVSINGTKISNYSEFMGYMANTTPGQNVTVGVVDEKGSTANLTMLLADYGGSKGYMGFGGYDLSDNAAGLLVGVYDAQGKLASLQNLMSPIGDTLGQKALNVFAGFVIIWVMPIWELQGTSIGFGVFQSDLAGFYHASGWAAPLGNGIFYVILALFWIGWINVNVAIFNCLPAIPLDGGHIFREITRVVLGRFVRDEERMERMTKTVVNFFAIGLFTAIVMMIIAPYIVHGI